MLEQKDTNIKDAKIVAIKGQRLSRAIYLVSSFFSDHDPIKWRIREKVIDLLNDSNFFGQNLKDNNDDKSVSLESNIVLNKLNGHLDQLSSLMELALTGGVVSEMNFSVLKQEISNLLEMVEKEINETSFSRYLNSPIISDGEDIKTVNGLPVSKINYQVSSNNHNGPHIGHIHLSDSSIGQNTTKSALERGNKPTNSTDNNLEKTAGKMTKVDNHINRKKIISDFVRGRGWTSIKDIAVAVHGCSEKTVQRLLVEMVDEGTLKKQGERRWSRYMLA